MHSGLSDTRTRILNMNPEQHAIVTSPARWNIAVAGPGSGKSTVIINRAKHLVAQGADPSSMAFVTFTGIGAKVLRRRLTESVGQVGFVGTLHAMMLLLLRRDDSRWVLISEEDAEAFLLRHAKLMGFRGSAKELEQAKALDEQASPITPALRAVREYRNFMRSEFMLDFDMVLTEGLRLLSRPASMANPWSFWFVDEFQDSSPVDARIYLTANPPHLFVVGDPDQSIYAFRGARPDNVTDFWNDWRFTKHVMSSNYRCTAPVCDVANAIISRNPGRIEKDTIPVSEADSKVSYAVCATDEAERLAVGVWVSDRIVSGISAEEVAVLCRTNRLASEMREHLAIIGVPVAETESEKKPKDWPLLMLMLSMIATPNSWAIARLLARLQAKFEKADPDAAEKRVEAARGTCSPASLWSFPSLPVILSLNADFSPYRISKASHSLLADRIRLYRPTTAEELLSVLREPGEVRHTRGVSVLTVHAAKGEEWTAVALPGIELYQDAEPEMREERRLAFVAVTRARRYLYASCAESRRVTLPTGQTVVQKRTPCEIFDVISTAEATAGVH